MSRAEIRVAFDHRIFVTQAWGGVSRYFVGMAQCLPAQGIQPRIVAPLHHNHYVAVLPRSQVWGWRLPEFAGSRRLTLAAGDALARPLARLAGAQIVHETYYGLTGLAPRGARLVLTVYDMIHELYANEIGDDATRTIKAAAIARADRILCISQSTLNDLVRFYPEVEARARVTLLGFDAATFVPRAGADGAGDRPYLLHVGHRASYKNFGGLLGAYAGSRRLRAEFDLVCGGGPTFNDGERELIAKHGLAGQVQQVAADDATLAGLYAGAALFVYPSLYEGFGIPPLEAMAAGCPVVAVRASSVPEVCGEAAHYAEDGSPEALGAAIEAVVWSPQRQAELRAAGAERVKQFTWEWTAAATAACYRELA
jgi:glycosyltransferase involved in cell wall biosynthesis